MVNVTALRLKARIGQLKALGALIVIFGGIAFIRVLGQSGMYVGSGEPGTVFN